ncbi:MAG: hypothetical protein HKM93_13520 [Desulfobacteraceae bacterium]|nr:hypothetical protein [Desulfobacteraceae bacterium]
MMIIKNDRILLRRTQVDDLKFVLGEERDKTNQPYVGQWEFDEHQAAIGNDDIAHWTVARPSDDRRIGYVILLGMTNPHNSIELMRIVISEKNKGIGRITLRLIQRATFSFFVSVQRTPSSQVRKAMAWYIPKTITPKGGTHAKENTISPTD